MSEKNKYNPFNPGSADYLTFEAKKVEDILYLIFPHPGEPGTPVKIICKPDYNIEDIVYFIDNHFPWAVPYEIVVENNSDVIK